MQNQPKNLSELQDYIASGDYKLKIKVIANAKTATLEFFDEIIKVKVKERALEGKANKAIIELLSKTLKIPKSKISITSGEKASIKTILFTKV